MIRREFSKNVLPAMLASVFFGIYGIVDGLFIGRNLGDLGLAAIGIAYPLTVVIQAVGVGIGLGGAVHIGISIGEENGPAEKGYLADTLALIGAACILTPLVMLLLYNPYFRLVGAEGDTLFAAAEYMKIIVLGAGFQIAAGALVPLLRNYNGAMAAMSAMIAGCLTNVALDWLFISKLQMGMRGAAWATVLGQVVSLLICLYFMLRWGKFKVLSAYRPSLSRVGRILTVGLSPFGASVASQVAVTMMNRAALTWGGEGGVACYCVVLYFAGVGQYFIQGVGDGCQPLLSRYFGAGEERAVKRVQGLAYIWAAAIAVAFMLGAFLLRNRLPGFFGASPEIKDMTAEALVIFSSGLLCFSFMRISTAYFYAVKRNVPAYILIYGELLLLFIALWLLPGPLGLAGVWLAVPTEEALLAALGVFWVYRRKRKTRDEQ